MSINQAFIKQNYWIIKLKYNHTVIAVYFVTARMWSRICSASSRVGVKINAYNGDEDDSSLSAKDITHTMCVEYILVTS